MKWLKNLLRRETPENIMQAAHEAALGNLTDMEDLEAYGKAVFKYDSQLAFLHSPEFWQAFRTDAEWANHCQYFGWLETDQEKIAYLQQLIPSSQ